MASLRGCTGKSVINFQWIFFRCFGLPRSSAWITVNDNAGYPITRLPITSRNLVLLQCFGELTHGNRNDLADPPTFSWLGSRAVVY